MASPLFPFYNHLAKATLEKEHTHIGDNCLPDDKERSLDVGCLFSKSSSSAVLAKGVRFLGMLWGSCLPMLILVPCFDTRGDVAELIPAPLRVHSYADESGTGQPSPLEGAWQFTKLAWFWRVLTPQRFFWSPPPPHLGVCAPPSLPDLASHQTWLHSTGRLSLARGNLPGPNEPSLSMDSSPQEYPMVLSARQPRTEVNCCKVIATRPLQAPPAFACHRTLSSHLAFVITCLCAFDGCVCPRTEAGPTEKTKPSRGFP